jgi:hypothetical protein
MDGCRQEVNHVATVLQAHGFVNKMKSEFVITEIPDLRDIENF